MNGTEPKTNTPWWKLFSDDCEDTSPSVSVVSNLSSFFRSFQPHLLAERFRKARKILIDSNLCSVWLFLLAMPTLALVIQCGLFLFGITCTAFPMWFSFLAFSVLALLIHWKFLLKFLGLNLIALVLTSYTFSYFGNDAEGYHIPMQLLLRNGWNPVFDSTIEKFSAIVDPDSLRNLHALFRPKTAAICGALVARSTGLLIADSFLGYLLLFVLLRTAFIFADKIYKCNWKCSLIFATTITLCSRFSSLQEGLVEFHLYTSLMITLFSLLLYVYYHNLHDFILAIIATAICGTLKTTGLINCLVFWMAVCLYSWKRKEAYWGFLGVVLLIAWIGMSPLITAWIQYGSPFYPLRTFDPKIQTVDITYDFLGNADAEQMGHLSRFVYAWISPTLAAKACALYYRNPDFSPTFQLPVTYASKDFGIIVNFLFCSSIVLLLLAKKNAVTLLCVFILITLVLCPVKYIGYQRYFPQAKAFIPLCFYQIIFFPPSWLKKTKLLQKILHCFLYFFLFLLCCFYASRTFLFQMKYMIMEGRRQALLAKFRENGAVVKIPRNTVKRYLLSQRLPSDNVDYEYSHQDIDMKHFEDDTLFPYFKEYTLDFWDTNTEYTVNNSPSCIFNSKWLDLFRYFPHPLFYTGNHIKTGLFRSGKENSR